MFSGPTVLHNEVTMFVCLTQLTCLPYLLISRGSSLAMLFSKFIAISVNLFF